MQVMSHYSANVFFQDGTILYGEFNSDGEVMRPSLYDTITEVMEHWRSGSWISCEHEGVEVIINPPGFYWRARACRQCKCIVDGFMAEDVTEGDYKL